MNPAAVDDLRPAWDDLLRPFPADAALADETFRQLTAAYAGPGRFYHNLDHLRQVLATVAQLRDLATDYAAVRFAAWFHDFVSDPHAGDNEERSTTAALETLPALGVDAGTVGRVSGLILLTKTHQPAEGDANGRVLVDADLATLAAPPDLYRGYADAIRREYAWVPEAAFRTRRRDVLERFLRRPRIYLTQRMFASCEEAARRNLAEEVAQLGGPS
jgi:predicted metal-dependent HD superfamily phosphohydrolase